MASRSRPSASTAACRKNRSTSSTLLITTGERVDVILAPTGKPGSTLVLRAMLYNRGYGSVQYRDVEELLTIEFSDEAPLPAKNRCRPSHRDHRAAQRQRRRDARARRPDAAAGRSGRQVGVPRQRRARTGKRSRFSPPSARPRLWDINNDTEWDHPFHLHGYFFLPLDEKDEPIRPLAWKDTVNIPMKYHARFLVLFDERPGEWMFHCHILDHAEGGLMGTVQVGPPSGKTHTHPKPR